MCTGRGTVGRSRMRRGCCRCCLNDQQRHDNSRPMASSMHARGSASTAAHHVIGSITEVKVRKRQGHCGFKIIIIWLTDGDSCNGCWSHRNVWHGISDQWRRRVQWTAAVGIILQLQHTHTLTHLSQHHHPYKLRIKQSFMKQTFTNALDKCDSVLYDE